MRHRKPRSARRSNDGLYQSLRHRWIRERQEAALAARRALTLEELQERAEEARRHHCGHTFIHPEVLLELLQVRDRLALVRELVEKHREMAEKGLPNANSMLWSNVLGFRKQE
jgi:hypothetical protein